MNVGRRRGAVLAAMAIVSVSACGGGSSGPSEADLLDPTKSPLAKVLGYDISMADQKVQQLEVEQAVAGCMKAEGWEYKPVDYSSMGGSSVWEAEYEEQMADPVAYGEKYGYGLVRNDELNAQANEEGGNTWEDPNQDYLNTLSMEEQQSYQETLYGKQDYSSLEEGEEYVPPPLEDQGCYGQAQLAAGNATMANPDIQAKLNDFYEGVENDPDLVAANKVWAACMADIDQSYEWKNPDEIWGDLSTRLEEAKGYTVIQQDDGWSTETPVDENGNYVEPEPDEAAIEQVRQDEIAIWKDDHECQGEAKILQVRRDIEQRLADELLEEFPELGEE